MNLTDLKRQPVAELIEIAESLEIEGVARRAEFRHHRPDFGIDSIAITYGYAPEGELEALAPTHYAANGDELRAILLREGQLLD